MTVKVDYSRDSLFDELGIKRLRDSYMLPTEASPQDRYKAVAERFGSNPEHSQRLYEYASKHWLSFSTPILAYGRSKKGLPISCFLSTNEDTAHGLTDTLTETAWLSMSGGGVGVAMNIRSADDKSVGVMPHVKIYDAHCLAYKQGSTRRGSYAMYLDVSHPDIIPFIEMRKATGDQNIRALNLHHGVNLSDEFMQLINKCMEDPEADDSWGLKNPGSDVVVKTVSAKHIWETLINTRLQTGEPYLHFIDTANNKLPKWLKDKGFRINGSNLCIEIELATNAERTAVCCLSSHNMDYYDDFKDDYLFYKDTLEMLDNVLDVFIAEAPQELSKAINSAINERSVGVGILGFHSYLQSKNIPFESPMAYGKNIQIITNMQEKFEQANKELGAERGEAPDAVGTGYRLSHTMAIAPTASSSIIMGNTSPSIEPYRANAYRQDTLSGSYLNKNKHLNALLKTIYPEEELDEVWRSIIANDGSVSHLDKLSDWDKDVFKTAMEINQQVIVEMAGARAEYIDQGQSVNLFFPPTVNIKYLSDIHMLAWKRGIKGLYYCRSEKVKNTDKVSQKIERVVIDECIACGS